MIYSAKYIFFAAVIVFLIVPAEINACSSAGNSPQIMEELDRIAATSEAPH
jgi:hypothetical protein